MRLISRHRNQTRARSPRISISQAEIAADLHYPASRRPIRTASQVAHGVRR